MGKIRICSKWRVYAVSSDYGRRLITLCESPLAPMTDFQNGTKEASKINHDGKCPYYKDRRGSGLKTDHFDTE